MAHIWTVRGIDNGYEQSHGTYNGAVRYAKLATVEGLGAEVHAEIEHPSSDTTVVYYHDHSTATRFMMFTVRRERLFD